MSVDRQKQFNLSGAAVGGLPAIFGAWFRFLHPNIFSIQPSADLLCVGQFVILYPK